MKPAFALDFRDDTVSLSHRVGGGWQIVGSVPLDTPDLAEALGYLRSTALGLAPRGLSTKLIIPNDQILYTEAYAPGPDAAARRAQVAASLEGRTPYAVADLAYDITGDGPYVQVAVIAKETLAEAEAFAVEHRFNPISFAAAPDAAAFASEPWFGASAFAASMLAAGDVVEPDRAEAAPAAFAPEAELYQDEVEVEADVSTELDLEPEAAPEFDQDYAASSDEPTDEPEAAFDAPELGIPEDEAPVAETPVSETPVAETPEPQGWSQVWPEGEAEVEGALPIADAPADAPRKTATEAAISDLESDDRDLIAALADTLAEPIVQPPPPPPTPPQVRLLPEAEEAPMALDVPDDDPSYEEPQGVGAIKAALSKQAQVARDLVGRDPAVADLAQKTLADTAKRVIDPALDDELPPMPSEAARLAFASRRQGEDDAPAAPAMGGVTRPAGAKPLPAVKAKAANADKAGKAGKAALRGLSNLVSGTGAKPRSKVVIPSALPPLKPAAKPGEAAPTAAPTASVRPAAARPNGGFPNRAPVRGKPRYLGLFLTVLLLFLLAMIAAWSSYSLGAWNFGAEDPVQTVSADPNPDATPDSGSALPTPEDEIAADGQDPEALADTTADAATAEPAPYLSIGSDIADNTAASNPTAGTNGEIFLAAMDAPPVTADPLSLPSPEARGDPLPLAEPAPPPFGTVYQFAANGTIKPTPEGITTPEGVLLRAGKPAIVPAPRPEAVAAAYAVAHPAAVPAAVDLAAVDLAAVDPAAVDPAAVDPAAVDPAAAAPATVPAFADPALAGKKPLPRPAGLTPPVAEQPSLAPAADSRIAGLHPKARPANIASAGRAAQQASAAASLTAQAEADTQEAALSGGSKLAIAISRRPAERPRDLSRAVEAAVAAAVRQPEPAVEPAPEPAPDQQVAVAEPGKDAGQSGDSEPEVTSAAPKIPTKASVAKQATFKNAINLSKINLIGVYGSASKRYALVRTAAGRYKKVRIGDTIDGGGRVAAITDSELRYQKGGRLVALTLPRE